MSSSRKSRGDEFSHSTALHNSVVRARKQCGGFHIPSHQDSSPNMNWDSQLYHHDAHSSNVSHANQSVLSGNLFPNTNGNRETNLELRKSFSSTENICASDLSTPSSSVIGLRKQRSDVCPDIACQSCESHCAEISDTPEGFMSSLEESFYYSSPDLSDASEVIQDGGVNEMLCTSAFSSSLKEGDTINSCADDSGYGCPTDESANDPSRFNLPSTESAASCCREAVSANRLLKKELHESKMKLAAKNASLVRLKDTLAQQYMEKEDVLQLKIKSDMDLKACEQQLETTRKSELHFRDNFYQSAAEVNTLLREHFLLHGEMTSNKILTNKLNVEKMQTNIPNKYYSRGSHENVNVAGPSIEAVTRYQEHLVPFLEQKVLHLEKQLEKLQDDTEELTFKAQRHEEENTTLCSQNAEMVKKCSDLQKQLVECLTMVDVLDVQCNDAESKLKRTRQTLEEKEKALITMSGEHTAALLKIEENEREKGSVRAELDNVTRSFVKISSNQRELKKDLLFYENVLKKRDQKIKQLTEDRKSIISRLEELEATKSCKDETNVFRKEANVQTNFPEELPEPWAEQCEQLKENIAVGDGLLAERMRILKRENEKLTALVDSLNSELEDRCAVGVKKMTHIMETIEKLEKDMNQYLATVEHKPRKREVEVELLFDKGEPQAESDVNRVLRENSELRQALTKMKEEVDRLRRSKCDLEEQSKKQAFWLDALLQGQEAGARQVAYEKLTQFKISPPNEVSIQPVEVAVRDVQFQIDLDKQLETASEQRFEGTTKRLSLETKAVLLENANNELVAYIGSLHTLVQSTAKSLEHSGGPSLLTNPQDLLHAFDLLCATQPGINVLDELYRISVFLHLCLLKTRTILPKERGRDQYYLPILSGLEGLLLEVRYAMAFESSREAKTENCPFVTMPMADCGPPEAEPNILVASKPELETQLVIYQKNNNMLREALATSEEERRKEQKRHKIQVRDLIQKFKLRLRENKINVSTWTSDLVKEGNRAIGDTSSVSEHRVCTDLVVNLQRNLRASESNIVEVQKQLRAKTEETWKLHQEIANLRSKLETVNDILDNKKIALGRSEAVGQMLKVSEASLEQRLELEQRQHEDCRQQLDKLAISLAETRTRSEDVQDLRRQLIEKEETLSALCKDYNKAVKEQEMLLQRCKDKDRELENTQNKVMEGFQFSKRAPMSHNAVPRNNFPTEEENAAKCAALLLAPPAPIMNQAELRNLIERAKLPSSDIMRLLDECVTHMSENLNLLQHHLEEKRTDDSSVFV